MGGTLTPEETARLTEAQQWNARLLAALAEVDAIEGRTPSPEVLEASAARTETRPTALVAARIRASVVDLRSGETYWVIEIEAEAGDERAALNQAFGRLVRLAWQGMAAPAGDARPAWSDVVVSANAAAPVALQVPQIPQIQPTPQCAQQLPVATPRSSPASTVDASVSTALPALTPAGTTGAARPRPLSTMQIAGISALAGGFGLSLFVGIGGLADDWTGNNTASLSAFLPVLGPFIAAGATPEFLGGMRAFYAIDGIAQLGGVGLLIVDHFWGRAVPQGPRRAGAPAGRSRAAHWALLPGAPGAEAGVSLRVITY